MEKKPKAFICYSKYDSDFAKVVYLQLTVAGIEVWLDQHQLSPGEEWRKGIDEGILSCDAVIVIHTPHSFQSPYVTYEWSFAIGNSIKVIPLFYNESDFHPRLAVLEYLDFRKKDNFPWEKLFAVITQAHENRTKINNNESRIKTETIFSNAGFFNLESELDFKVIKSGIQEANQRVCIMDNWICEDIQSALEVPILEALQRDVMFEIAILDPTSRFAIQRSMDLKKDELHFVPQEIQKNVKGLTSIFNSYKNSDFYIPGRFNLRLYRCLPTVELHIFDDMYVFGSFLWGRPSTYTPHIFLRKSFETEEADETIGFIASLEKNFNDVFNLPANINPLQNVI